MDQPSDLPRSTVRNSLGWIFAFLLIGSLFYLLRSLDLHRVSELVLRSHPGLLALAVAVNLTLNTYARVSRRRALLVAAGATPALGLSTLTRLFFASYAANNLLPARAGDVLFALQLRQHGYRAAATMAAQVTEKIIELASLWLLIPITVTLTTMTPVMDNALYLFFIAGGVVGGLLITAVRAGRRSFSMRPTVDPTPSGTLSRLLHRVRHSARAGLDAIGKIATPRVALRALAWSSAQDASDVLMVGLVAIAVGIHVGPGGWLLVYLAVNLASALPSTPGQIGLIEAGAVFALVGLGVGQSEAVAFALLYHAAHLIPITLVGLPLLLRLRWQQKHPTVAPPSLSP